MKDYRLLMCIVKRDQYESYLNMLKSIGIEAQAFATERRARACWTILALKKQKKCCFRHSCRQAISKKFLEGLWT